MGMREDFDRFDELWAALKQAIWEDRWRLGIILGGCWLVSIGILAWWTWLR